MLIYLNRQLVLSFILIAAFTPKLLANTKDWEKKYQVWRSLQLERAKQLMSKEGTGLSIEKNASDEFILSKYREFVLKKLGNLSPEEQGFDGRKGIGQLNLPAFKKLFSNSVTNNRTINSSSEETWQLAWGAAENYWQNFYSWYQKDSYQKDLNHLLKKIKSEQKKLISKKNWLKGLNTPFSSYLQNYSHRQLKNLKQRKIEEFFQIHLIKDLGKVEINQEKESFTVFLTRLQSCIGGISLFLSGLGLESEDDSQLELLSIPMQTDQPSYFKPEDNVDEFTWIEEKIKYACDVIPEPILLEGGLYKVVRIMLAHVIFRLNVLDENLEKSEIDQIIFRSLQSGFYFGLTYPLIDDLSDSNKYLDDSLRETMESIILGGLSGAEIDTEKVPEHPISMAIINIFRDLQKLYPRKDNSFLWDSLYVLFRAQVEDRKNIDISYSVKEVYIPVILKSSFTRIITAAFTGNISKEYIEHAFATAFINQLNDDACDHEQDKKYEQFTPFTWFFDQHQVSQDSNPFHIYLASLTYLNVIYGKNSRASEACIQRLIWALGRLYRSMGHEEFKFLLEKYELEEQKTVRYLTKLAMRHPSQEDSEADAEERLKYVAIQLKERKAIKSFNTYLKNNRPFIEEILPIKSATELVSEQHLTTAMNYSIQAGGKRIRPILALMAGDFYGIESARLVPFFRSLEYLHTSSLILDDLPAQDGANLRRGEPTLHKAYDEPTAQLSSVKLLAKAIGQISELDSFDTELINELTSYASETIEQMCDGQMMDLQAHNQPINSVQKLETLSYLKTGLAIEASILPVARLAQASNEELTLWKSFARNFGLLFQIRDDILDVEGDQKLLGKVVGTDEANHASTFVSLLGLQGAYSLLSETWLAAKHDLIQLEANGKSTQLFQGALDFVFFRDH